MSTPKYSVLDFVNDLSDIFKYQINFIKEQGVWPHVPVLCMLQFVNESLIYTLCYLKKSFIRLDIMVKTFLSVLVYFMPKMQAQFFSYLFCKKINATD